MKRMNPDVKVTAHQNQVGPGTEQLYGDDFFQRLDGVVSAVDTLDARECRGAGAEGTEPPTCPCATGADTLPSLPAGAYLEKRCICSRTPLLDSGTEGARGNVVAMVPPLTEPLGSATSSTDGTFPLCTLRYYPHTIEHTLQVRLQVSAPGLLFSLPVSPALQAGCSPSCFLLGAAVQPQRLPQVPAPSPAWPGPGFPGAPGAAAPHTSPPPAVPAGRCPIAALLQRGLAAHCGAGSLCGTRCSSPVPSAQWARDEFEGLFQLPAESVNQFLE